MSDPVKEALENVSVSAISVSPDGRIEIKSDALAKALEAHAARTARAADGGTNNLIVAQQEPGPTNYVACGNNYKCGKGAVAEP